MKYEMLLIIAGLVNGSFAVPAKKILNVPYTKIWLTFSIVSLILLPWLVLYFGSNVDIKHYLSLDNISVFWIILSGFIFGIGQICLAVAIRYVGIGLSFAVNISIGTLLGSLGVAYLKNNLFNQSGLFLSLAIVLIIYALFLYYKSMYHANDTTKTEALVKGWILACIAGMGSGLQNVAFVVVSFHSFNLFSNDSSFWFWPPFLLAAGLIMLIGFYLLNIKEKSQATMFSIKDYFMLLFMGLAFVGSLYIYSLVMNKLDHLQQIIGWPIFMTAIILTSQLWGISFGEIDIRSKKTVKYLIGSISLLCLSVVIISLKN